MNFCLNFISGLPGAIDYAMLAAVKLGRMSRLREKRCNCAINVWLRLPGLVVNSAIAWCCFAHGSHSMLPAPMLLFSLALGLGNGLFYGEQVPRPACHAMRHASLYMYTHTPG